MIDVQLQSTGSKRDEGIQELCKPAPGKPDNENTQVEQPVGEIRVSVRGLVEFILRHGDIDNRRQGAPDNAMQEGSRIHRMIQRRMGAEYQAEVSLKYTHSTEKYMLIVEGRASQIWAFLRFMAMSLMAIYSG